jgi:flavorubredoxin
MTMMDVKSRIDEVGPGIYQIGTFDPTFGISVNQFLIDDDEPTLIHTGTHPMYDLVASQVGKVLDPKTLKYVVVPHFESDECGGMGRLIACAKGATLVCAELGAMLNLSGWDYAGPVKGMRDGDVLQLGGKRLRFMETPHVHHWDSMMVVEETENVLFPADLFIQPGEQLPVVKEDLGKEMCELYREVGIFGSAGPVLTVVNRIERLGLRGIHPMHGGSLMDGEVIGKYVQALRTMPFAFEGKVFGRMLPT